MTATSSSARSYAELRAAWLASLEADEVLPERLVLVRNEAVAHCWRRDLVTANRADLLVGTRFLTSMGCALEVLEREGVQFELGEEAVRAARIAMLLLEGLPLTAFRLDVLRDRPGWDQAFARTIGDLEAAGFAPDMIASSPDPRCRDIAMIWSRLEELAGTSWTSSRALREAAALLEADPSRWPFTGACLIEISGHESPVLARWLRAIPRSIRVGRRLRPERTEHMRRLDSLLGDVTLVDLVPDGTCERDLLARYLFATPDVLTAPSRPRSTGIDGTVQIEQHAGLDEELDAAVDWVMSEVAEHGTPLERLAVVVPRLDPYATLLAHRFDALGADAVHVVGGLPASSTASGARIRTILRALAGFLHIDEMASVIPLLRLESNVQLSRRSAIALLYELGTAGGGPAHPDGSLEWRARLAARRRSIDAALAGGAASPLDEQERERLARLQDELAALEPAMNALDRAARALVSRSPIDELWSAIRSLCDAHVRTGSDGKRILAALDGALAPVLAANLLAGLPALDAITRTLDAVRLPVGRFGEPRVTIVSLTDTMGLSFASVRVFGLVEGIVPDTPHEDPVLPDAVRVGLPYPVPTSSQRSLAQLHALHHVVSVAAQRVVLSTARMDDERRYREPSGVITEAAAAIGRDGAVIPDARALRRSYFEPARRHSLVSAERWPVTERGRLQRAARSHQIPAAWPATQLLPLRMPEVESTPGIMDGWFPPGPFAELPGLSADLPISASALSRLLECPHRFLYERVLGWNPPPELLDEGTIDALSYGSLFHETAEDFYRRYGGEFCARHRTLAEWKAIAAALADARFVAFLERYPLLGDEVRTAQRARLHRDMHALLDSDWSTAKTFVDVERSFGPLPLLAGGEEVYVRGIIDRLDTIGAKTLVRDLKTGRAKPREKDPWLPSYDIQLGLYGLVVRDHAAAWGLPTTIAGSYVYPSDSSGDERAFYDDFDELAKAAEGWLALGAKLLRLRRFPRTPIEDECRFCSFRAVCGPAAQTRAAELLTGDAELRELASLKLGEDEDG